MTATAPHPARCAHPITRPTTQPSPAHRGAAALTGRIALTALLTLTALPCAWAHGGHQHAHVHGRLSLDVAVEDAALVIHLHTPLDSVLGFERTPRTPAEHRQAEHMAAQLRAADQWLLPDPQAHCTLAEVVLDSPVLKLDDTGHPPAPTATPHNTINTSSTNGKGTDSGHNHNHDHHHADLTADIIWTCTQPAQARFLDVKLFDTFPRLHAIDAQIATARGQSGQTLQPGKTRLRLQR